MASLNTARDLVQMHQPDVLLLTETKLSKERVQQVVDRFPFDGWAASETIGFRGGILLMWNTRKVNVHIMGSTEQEIHVVMQVCNSNSQWLFSGIYVSPRYKERKVLWANLETIAETTYIPWIVLGDFNEVVSESEKLGGGTINFNKALRFSEMLSNCCLTDLGFSGPRFTWTNLRQTGGLIQERLDRAVANPSWRIMFPNAEVSHLPRVHSDHCPVLLDFNPRRVVGQEKPFRFETMWLSHPTFESVVIRSWEEGGHDLQSSIEIFCQRVTRWNKEVFGNVFQEKKKTPGTVGGYPKKDGHSAL